MLEIALKTNSNRNRDGTSFVSVTQSFNTTSSMGKEKPSSHDRDSFRMANALGKSFARAVRAESSALLPEDKVGRRNAAIKWDDKRIHQSEAPGGHPGG
jgi:hypothetical protein